VRVADWLHALAVGIPVFAATNTDDLLLLAVFFSDPRFPPRQIVAGQLLGIGALVLLSAGAALAAVAVPPGWVALLGIAPLWLGVRALRGDDDGADPEALPRSRLPWLAVAAVTVANGGDNLGVYIPLFARAPAAIPAYAAIFTALTALWCFAGHALVSHRRFGERVRRAGRRALPFVLIALGVWILAGARALWR
jgi:cadmium resistance protein CadD (predicted permease)